MGLCSHFLKARKSSLIGMEVDLGGSLAVASKGLFATGVSTDLSGEALNLDFIKCIEKASLTCCLK